MLEGLAHRGLHNLFTVDLSCVRKLAGQARNEASMHNFFLKLIYLHSKFVPFPSLPSMSSSPHDPCLQEDAPLPIPTSPH